MFTLEKLTKICNNQRKNRAGAEIIYLENRWYSERGKADFYLD